MRRSPSAPICKTVYSTYIAPRGSASATHAPRRRARVAGCPLMSGTTLSRPPPPPPRPPPPPPPRGARQAPDDVPVFDRNKVSLDFPGSLFGPSVSLLIKTTKIVGDVIQNSAVRYQTFLRLFRPLFRGQFEIKGLDPPTTTTTTTTAAPAAPSTPAAADNELRRRRRTNPTLLH
ncbi:hypothetical protein MSG28_012022 [Choristoneura fumiferana]|uniref:Uncharacterized protein n=1 Tax=Choristoneura fumiferana TaxID=7141 RepID=A0ACC0KP07_CHOFU|nr:hypothetical protein MSG28_012022 [Choristoneura fumiferana]